MTQRENKVELSVKEKKACVQEVEIFILIDNQAKSKQFYKENGLSVLVRALYPQGIVDILFDTSITGEKVLSNMKKMKLNVSKIYYIVLSHKHYDHTGGLVKILEAKNDWIPVLHGKNFFRSSIAVTPFLWHITTMPFVRQKIADLKGMLTPIWKPLEFAPGIFVSGRIPFMTDFEVPNPPAYRMIPPHMTQDDLEEELSLIVNLEKELIIVTGCSHRGIVNIVKNAVAITGISNIRAIVGGLHLGSASEERVAKTIKELGNLGVKEYYIGHCTGDEIIKKFKSAFGGVVYRTKSGLRIKF